jgi:hypothetical protein
MVLWARWTASCATAAWPELHLCHAQCSMRCICVTLTAPCVTFGSRSLIHVLHLCHAHCSMCYICVTLTVGCESDSGVLQTAPPVANPLSIAAFSCASISEAHSGVSAHRCLIPVSTVCHTSGSYIYIKYLTWELGKHGGEEK